MHDVFIFHLMNYLDSHDHCCGAWVFPSQEVVSENDWREAGELATPSDGLDHGVPGLMRGRPVSDCEWSVWGDDALDPGALGRIRCVGAELGVEGQGPAEADLPVCLALVVWLGEDVPVVLLPVPDCHHADGYEAARVYAEVVIGVKHHRAWEIPVLQHVGSDVDGVQAHARVDGLVVVSVEAELVRVRVEDVAEGALVEVEGYAECRRVVFLLLLLSLLVFLLLDPSCDFLW